MDTYVPGGDRTLDLRMITDTLPLSYRNGVVLSNTCLGGQRLEGWREAWRLREARMNQDEHILHLHANGDFLGSKLEGIFLPLSL